MLDPLIPMRHVGLARRVPVVLLIFVLLVVGCRQDDSARDPTSIAPTATTSVVSTAAATSTPLAESSSPLSPSPGPTVTPPASPTADDTSAMIPEGQEVDLPDVDLSYDIDATVENFDTGEIAAMMTAHVTSREDAPLDELFFRVPPAVDDFFTLRSLARDGETIASEPSDNGTTLGIVLDPPIAAGETTSLSFAFELDLGLAREAHPFNNALIDDPVLRLGYWYPMLSNDAGFPPLLDPPYTVIADFEVRLTAPANVVVAAPASSAEPPTESAGSVEYVWTLENGRDFALMLSREYEVEERDAGGVTVRIFTVPSLYGDGDPARQAAIRERIFEIAELSLEEYARLVGPYQWDTLVIAEGGRFLGGGIEYTALTIIDVDADWLDVLVAHEVAHMWFYAAVGTRTQDDPWIDEGVATFLSEGLLNGYDSPSDRGRQSYADSLDASVYDLDGLPFNDWVPNVYTQGGSFYADLYIEMGENDFWSAMREIYDTQLFGIVTAYEVLTIFQDATDENLEPLYERYFEYEWVGS